MGTRRRRSDRALRVALRSPGRPWAARREDRRQFWAAIAAGRSSEAAAIEAGVSPAVGARWFREAGGMPPTILAPSAKPPSERYLVFAEREETALCRAQGQGIREIARRLGRAASTISRELRRNAATRGGGLAYRASTAQWHAERAARRPKRAKLATTAALRTSVQERLSGAVATPGGAAVVGPAVAWKGRRHGRRQHRRWAKAWSPEQIARRLRIDFPGDETMCISHEAIYQALYVQGRGALRRELTACLRTGRALRVPRARSRRAGKGFVDPAILISQRPAEAADRAVPGHWEGDLILGLGSSAIGTLVERTTRFTMLLHLPRMDGHGFEARTKNGPALAGHGAEAVRGAIARTITTLPQQLRRSLTWIRERKWPSTPSYGSRLAWRSTSAIPTAPGSAARTRTPMGCCASTFQRALTSARTARTILRPWRLPSTAGLARPWAGKHLPRRLTGSYDQPKQAMLRRPLESAQYASDPYRAVLERHGIQPSMSRRGNCLDCESVGAAWRT